MCIGSEPGMLDYNMWPWFERTSASGIFQGKVMPEGKYPNLRAWMNNMYKTDAVKATGRYSKIQWKNSST